jgi:hypothetical protein
MTPNEFIQQYAPYAQRVSRLTGIDPRIVLAQAALETGYGKSAPNFNIFGIKGKGSTQQTKEFIDGRMVSMPQEFRSYESPEQSFADYAKLMQGKRYAGVRGGQTLAEQISALQQSGYATDPNYGSKISKIAQSIDLEGLPTGNMRVSAREGSPMDQMQQPQQPQQPMGLMDRLRDPRTRLALSALSRSSAGERLGQLAASDLLRQQALEDEQRKLGQAQQKDNRTAAWLRTQPSGGSYADAIEKGGIDAKTIYAQYVSDRKDLTSPNVQSSKMLPDNSGSVLTMRDGSLVVKTVGQGTLTGQEAIDFVEKAEANYVANQQAIYGARRTGTLTADVELGGQAEQVKAEGKNKVAWIDDIRSKRDNIMSTIENYDMAMQALDAGASTGRVAALLPTVTAQTQLLETAKKQLGLDVIGSVTFGALSEGELALAMDTGLPSSNLGPEELRKWIMDRKAAKEKAAQALFETAAYLAKPDTTYESYYTDFLGINKPAGGAMSDNPLGL